MNAAAHAELPRPLAARYFTPGTWVLVALALIALFAPVMLAVAVVLPQLLLSGGLGPDYYARMASGLQRVADLLPALGLQGPVHVVGHDWGGARASATAQAGRDEDQI